MALTKLTPEVQRLICQGIRIGLTYEKAAVMAGVTRQSIHNWIGRGEKAKSGKFFDFFNALQRAKEEGQVTLASDLNKLAKGGLKVREKTYKIMPDGTRWLEKEVVKETLPDRTAIQFILERRHSEDWGSKDKIDITAEIDMSPTFETNLDDDELEQPGEAGVLAAPEE